MEGIENSDGVVITNVPTCVIPASGSLFDAYGYASSMASEARIHTGKTNGDWAVMGAVLAAEAILAFETAVIVIYSNNIIKHLSNAISFSGILPVLPNLNGRVS